MVNQDMVEDSGHSTKVATVSKKHCHYYLLQTLKNSAAVQEYLAVELGLGKSCILVGSRLPRGGWESWIDKRKCLDVETNNQSPTPRPVLKTKTNSNEGARRAPRTSIKSQSMSLNGQ